MVNIIISEKKALLKKEKRRFLISFIAVLVLVSLLCLTVSAAQLGDTAQGDSNTSPVTINFNQGQEDGRAFGIIEMMFILMILALLPSILVLMTSFTRIIIVLSLLRNALGTQQSPPNQVLIGIALFLTLFIMNPVLTEIKDTAYEPYKEGVIEQEEFVKRAVKPMKIFMLKQTQTKDLNLFLSIAERDELSTETAIVPETLTDLGLEIVVPSFVTSELKRAFTMGFLLFIPFLIIDMVVSSTLMSMGMVMLPPAMIALPFKLMMFVLIDGWGMVFGTLVKSFR